MRWISLIVLTVAMVRGAAGAKAADPFDGLPLLLEIDPAKVPPVDEKPAGASKVEMVLGQPARVMEMRDELAGRFVYRIGAGAGLKAGAAYVLEIEYPDDVPRAFFLANRAADYVRGWATGPAMGDALRQYVRASNESLNYPQTKQWQRYRQFFIMQERLQGVIGRRSADPGCRPNTPADGFDLIFFQTTRPNDPRSAGLAIGRIRLYGVPDVKKLHAPLNRPPAELPQRRVFWREEMADQAISGKAAADRAFDDPLNWYAAKLQLARVLGMDTFAKDLLEFGFNQGWESGDQKWCMNAQPPLSDIWGRLVPLLGKEGFTVLPYYEYKGALGLPQASPRSLGWQRRAEKLYHGIHKTGHNTRTDKYSGVWWTEDHNADLTDPDTLADFRRVLDRTVFRFDGEAKFAGVWMRVRNTHLPISFSDAAVARFRSSLPDDAEAQKASRPALIASYEGDQKLYNRYIDWWLKQRAAFLSNIQQDLRKACGGDAQVIFTPWVSEQVPELIQGKSVHQACGVISDDPAWYDTFAKTQKDGWYRWNLVPTKYEEVIQGGWWARSLALRRPINDPSTWQHAETFHSAPHADPENYRDVPGVMMSYPIGRTFTVAGPEPISSFRAASGLTAIHHFTLNENDLNWEAKSPGEKLSFPFQDVVGYTAVDVDRAGPLAMLNEARAVAYGDPRNLAMLCGSNFSSGFPLEFRRFVQAFVAAPALPSKVMPGAASDGEVVVREIPAGKHGTYYYVINTSWNAKPGVSVKLAGEATDLVDGTRSASLKLDLAPAELRAYRVGP